MADDTATSEVTTEIEATADAGLQASDDQATTTEAQIPEPEVSSSESEAPAISDGMFGRAKDYGLSQDDVSGFDDARLDRMFSAIDRRIMGSQVPAGQATGYSPEARSPEPVASAPAASAPVAYSPLKLDFGDDLDESVVGPFKSVIEHMNGQLKSIHESRLQVQQELQAMNVLREFSDFDRFVTGLGSEWNAEYGGGTTMEMDPQSANFQKRLEVFQGARSLMSDAQRRGQRMSNSDALTRSHRAVHWDRIAEHERNKLDGKIDRRRKGFSERPVKGKAPAMSPRDEAIAAWTK